MKLGNIKNKLISVGLTLACTGSLIVFALTSFSWFSNNAQVSSEGGKIKAYIDDSVQIRSLKYVVYGYNMEKSEPFKLDGDNVKLELGDYDMFIAGRNTYNRRIMRMTLNFPNGHTANDELCIKIRCTGDFKDKNGKVLENISNLLSFRFFDNSGNFDSSMNHYIGSLDEQNLGIIYQQCINVFDGNIEGLDEIETFEFINKVANDYVKANEISSGYELVCSIPLPSLAQSGYVSTDFFIEINYSDELVQYYESTINDDDDSSNTIVFNQDVTEMEFSLKTK